MTKKKKKEDHKITNKVSKFIFILLLISSIIFCGMLYKSNTIPDKFIYIIYGGIGLINIINFIILWPKNIKKGIKIFIDLIAILLISIFLFLSLNINKTIDLFNKSILNYKVDEFYILVDKKSNYSKINDINNETIALFSGNINVYDKALNKLDKVIKYDSESYEDLKDLWDDFKDNKIKAMFISKSHYQKLEYIDEEYPNKVKILYTIKITEKTNTISKNVNVTKEPFSIYISGMDSYGKIESTSNSDVNIIMTINPLTKKVLLISIPRDYYVQLYDKTGYKDKLTHSSMYGIETTIKTIENLLEMDINYYIKVNFTTLEDLVDAIEGITVYNDKYFCLSIEPHYCYKKGNIDLNGKRALGFARERKSFLEGDRKRGEHQELLIEAIINKVSTSTVLINKYSSILDSFDGKFATNMNMDKITSLVKMQLNDMAKWDIESISLTGTDSYNYTYSYGKDLKLYVMEPDADSVINAISKIDTIMNNNNNKSVTE